MVNSDYTCFWSRGMKGFFEARRIIIIMGASNRRENFFLFTTDLGVCVLIYVY